MRTIVKQTDFDEFNETNRINKTTSMQILCHIKLYCIFGAYLGARDMIILEFLIQNISFSSFNQVITTVTIKVITITHFQKRVMIELEKQKFER